MVYRRFYKRGRSSRRRTLSNYRIATRTSARSQAKQIYALKKRMTAIQRRTKPEIMITRRTAATILSTGTVNSVSGALQFAYGSGSVISFQPQLPSITTELNAGTGVLSPNRFARLLSFKLTGSISYSDTPQITATPYALRIVIIQSRTTRANAINASDVFLDNNPVFNSLQTGLARTAKVLSDRRYYLSYQRPVIRVKSVIRRLMSFYNDSTSTDGASTSSEPVPKGCIFVLYAYRPLLGVGVENPTGNINVELEGKLAYTDS